MTLEHRDRFSWIFWNYITSNQKKIIDICTIVLRTFSKFESCRAQLLSSWELLGGLGVDFDVLPPKILNGN